MVKKKEQKRETIALLELRNAADRFTILPSGFIWDKFCKIARGPTFPNRMTKLEAIAACKAMGCFLEEAEEAESLIDRSKDPCLLATYPGEMKTDGYYWTNTKTPWNTNASFVVSFFDGYVYYNCGDVMYYVRPVRASQD